MSLDRLVRAILARREPSLSERQIRRHLADAQSVGDLAKAGKKIV
jgi:hypothetical protein